MNGAFVMNVTSTPGIAAAWSAAKTSPNDQAVRPANSQAQAAEQVSREASEPRKSPPAPEGQGTQVDVQA